MSNPEETNGFDEGRRRFLKEAGSAALGLGWGLPVLSACSGAGVQGQAVTQERQWAMVVDVERCRPESVRRAAIEACHRVHNVPDLPDPDDEVKWIWTAEYQHLFPEQVHDAMPPDVLELPVLALCNHCENPPCVRVCPTQATWKRESDGIVMMDMHRCIGCRYCMAACPYGSRSFNWRDPRPYIESDGNGDYPSDFPTRTKGVVEKCNFCAERLRDGLQPACVEAVQEVDGGEGALVFGDLFDPDSEASRILRERRTIVRRPEMGTGPKVYYIV